MNYIHNKRKETMNIYENAYQAIIRTNLYLFKQLLERKPVEKWVHLMYYLCKFFTTQNKFHKDMLTFLNKQEKELFGMALDLTDTFNENLSEEL